MSEALGLHQEHIPKHKLPEDLSGNLKIVSAMLEAYEKQIQEAGNLTEEDKAKQFEYVRSLHTELRTLLEKDTNDTRFTEGDRSNLFEIIFLLREFKDEHETILNKIPKSKRTGPEVENHIQQIGDIKKLIDTCDEVVKIVSQDYVADTNIENNPQQPEQPAPVLEENQPAQVEPQPAVVIEQPQPALEPIQAVPPQQQPAAAPQIAPENVQPKPVEQRGNAPEKKEFIEGLEGLNESALRRVLEVNTQMIKLAESMKGQVKERRIKKLQEQRAKIEAVLRGEPIPKETEPQQKNPMEQIPQQIATQEKPIETKQDYSGISNEALEGMRKRNEEAIERAKNALDALSKKTGRPSAGERIKLEKKLEMVTKIGDNIRAEIEARANKGPEEDPDPEPDPTPTPNQPQQPAAQQPTIEKKPQAPVSPTKNEKPEGQKPSNQQKINIEKNAGSFTASNEQVFGSFTKPEPEDVPEAFGRGTPKPKQEVKPQVEDAKEKIDQKQKEKSSQPEIPPRILSKEELAKATARELIDENEGFAEFLSGVPNSEQVLTNEKMVKLYYDAYSRKEEVFGSWKSFILKQYESRVDLAVTEDFDVMRKYFDGLVQRDPARILFFNNLFVEQASREKNISSLEQEFIKRGGDQLAILRQEETKLQEKSKTLDQDILAKKNERKGFRGRLQQVVGTFTRSNKSFAAELDSLKQQKAHAEAVLGKVRDTANDLESKQNRIKINKKEVEELKSGAMLQAVRFEEVRDILKERATSRLRSYFDSSSKEKKSSAEELAIADKMDAFLQNIVSLEENNQLYLDVDPDEIKDFQEKIKERLKVSVEQNILDILQERSVETTGKGKLTKLEKELEPFFNREKIGKNEGKKEVAEFILTMLQQVKENTRGSMRTYLTMYIDSKKKEIGIK